MRDRFGREINYMRVSVTDRCNLRCCYCMPEGVEIVPMSRLLTLEEIVAVCRLASDLGIDRIKVTGGEPLVRRGVAGLIGMLKEIPGIRQVTMTTNGILLGEHLEDLLQAGLDAVNISLDTTDPVLYRHITGKDCLDRVLSGMGAAVAAGLPVKINSVLMRGVNEEEWLPLLHLAKEHPVDVRFIEIMPIGVGADQAGVSNKELIGKVRDTFSGVVPDEGSHGNGPAVYYRIPSFSGSVGFISAMHGKFCESCNRIRMTAMGDIKPCLCYDTSVNIREVLRQQGEEAAKEVLSRAIFMKPEAHCFEHRNEITEKKKMIAIGG